MKKLLAGFLPLLLLFAACSETERWEPFCTDPVSLNLLPLDEAVVRIEGGTPPYSLAVEDHEAVEAWLEQTDGKDAWQLCVKTIKPSQYEQTALTLTDNEGRTAQVIVYASFVQVSYRVSPGEVFLSPRLMQCKQRAELEDIACRRTFPLDEMRLSYFSSDGGYCDSKSLRDVPFQWDDAREHIAFAFSAEETFELLIHPLIAWEDDHAAFPWLRWYALPSSSLLLDDFTAECREFFPGLLAGDDYVLRGYYVDLIHE